jgi:hypothetical protein
VADHIIVHPAWFTAGPCFGNSKHACLEPGHEDIALVFLKSTVAGVTPAPIAGAGYLDSLNLKTATFTVVGYGTDAFITGSGASPKAITIFDGIRSYRIVSALPATDAFPDRFLKITKGVCFGDSGGPLFHNGTVVAINTGRSATAATGRTSSTGSTRRSLRRSSTRTSKPALPPAG